MSSVTEDSTIQTNIPTEDNVTTEQPVQINVYLQYLQMGLAIANKQLEIPAKIIESLLMLNMNNLPSIFHIPVIFIGALLTFFLILISYAGSMICTLLGVVYPLIECQVVLNEKTVDSNKLVTIVKYFILYQSYVLLENIFYFILELIPFYQYFRFGVTYMLLRDDYAMTRDVYDFLDHRYKLSPLPHTFTLFLEKIEKFINFKKEQAKTD